MDVFSSRIGNYTCRAANTNPATVQVYVSEGKICNFSPYTMCKKKVNGVEHIFLCLRKVPLPLLNTISQDFSFLKCTRFVIVSCTCS